MTAQPPLSPCSRCSTQVEPARLVFSPQGDSVCMSCSTQLQAEVGRQAGAATHARGAVMLGGVMALLGASSALNYFVGMNVRLLMWIDNWGPAVGWSIRGAMIVVGAALYFGLGGAKAAGWAN